MNSARQSVAQGAITPNTGPHQNIPSTFHTLLPSNTAPGLRDFEEVAARIGNIDVEIHNLWNPAECPEHLLGWLAWALSVDVWDDAWNTQTKRAVLAESVKVHRIKGTRKSIMDALAAIEFDIEITEWFNADDAEAQPHTFYLDAFGEDIFATGGGINAKTFNRVKNSIDHVKSARDHFTLRIGEDRGGAITLRTGSCHSAIESRAIKPMIPIDDHQARLSLRTGHSQGVISHHTHIFQIGDAA